MVKLGAPKAVGVSRDKARRHQDKREAGAAEGAKKAPRQSMGPDDASIKIYEPAARMRGGPRDSWVYYIRDLEQAQRSALNAGLIFDYAPTKAKCTLPWTGGVEGVWWNWIGAQ